MYVYACVCVWCNIWSLHQLNIILLGKRHFSTSSTIRQQQLPDDNKDETQKGPEDGKN